MHPTRTRWWVLVVPLALVAIYITGWAVYADQHLRPHYTRAAPGATADARGVTWRVRALTTTDSLTSSSGAPPAVPDVGAVWVVADLEALQHPGGERFSCEVDLLGPDEQVWKRDAVVPVQRAARCDPEQLVAGRPYRFEAIFLVPQRHAHQLGVLVPDLTTAAPTPVLTPLA